MPSSFPAHGHFELTLDGRILVNRAHGPWNTELVAAYDQAVADAVAQLSGAPWGVLAFVSGKPVHTPEARERMIAAVQAQRLQGRCGTVHIFEAVEGPGLMRVIQSSIYQAAGEPLFFADSEAAGREWLLERIKASSTPA